MRVRRATATDVEQIAEVHVASWQAGYRGLLPQPLLDGLHPSQRIPRWTTTVQQADWPRRGTLVVVDHDGDLVGLADLRPTYDERQDPALIGEIASFYVLPARWGQGIGRQLMDTAVAVLAEAGYRSASLWVLDGNVSAITFYVHLGWTPDGAVRDDVLWGAAIRDLRYRRELP